MENEKNYTSEEINDNELEEVSGGKNSGTTRNSGSTSRGDATNKGTSRGGVTRNGNGRPKTSGTRGLDEKKGQGK